MEILRLLGLTILGIFVLLTLLLNTPEAKAARLEKMMKEEGYLQYQVMLGEDH